jgi:hypothetical protein
MLALGILIGALALLSWWLLRAVTRARLKERVA